MFTTRYSAHVHGACRQVGCQQGGLVRRDQRQQRCVLRRSVRLVTPSLLSAPYHPARRRTHTNHLVFVSPCTVPTTTFATHLSPQRPSPHICPHNDLRHTSVPTTTFATHLSTPQRPSPHICPHNDLRHTSVDPTTTFATHLSPQRPSPHICFYWLVILQALTWDSVKLSLHTEQPCASRCTSPSLSRHWLPSVSSSVHAHCRWAHACVGLLTSALTLV
jgi:hypothetical protein